jgi:hypothetical protein
MVIIVVEKIHFCAKAGVATPRIATRYDDSQNNDPDLKPSKVNAEGVSQKRTNQERRIDHTHRVNEVRHIIPKFLRHFY